MKIFPHIDKSVDYSGFNRDNWNLRIHAQHLLIADCAKNATTQAEREHHEHKAGVRYTELLQLQYLDLARCHLIDPMHNLFLGTSKRMINLWKARGYLSDTMCEKLQRKMDLIVPPAYTGRLPSKVEAGFAGFTAEQFMLWTTLYSPFVLRDFLPENLYSHWCLFSKACSILCKSCIKKDEVKTADKLLLEFCVGVETLYGYQACTPNMHLHCHLRDCILDVGPLNSFWCFSFERYNGILENMKKTWNSPESQLIHKFSNLQAFTGVTLPQSASPELIHCFTAMRDSKSALPDPIVMDGYAVRNYEMNISCPAADICMLKMDFHSVSLPGREKFMTEVQKDLLTEMYATVYGSENVHYIPLRHVQFHQVYVFDEAFTSKISRTTRSSMVVGFWPQLSSILKTSPCTEDIRVGEIQYFIIHKPILKSQSGQPLQQSNKEHMLAVVHWFQDHP